MKRIAYVSRATSILAPGELQAIATTAQANNRRLDITGMLTYDDGVFSRNSRVRTPRSTPWPIASATTPATATW